MDSGFPIKCVPTSSSDEDTAGDPVRVGCVATLYVGSHLGEDLPEKLTQNII